MEKKIENYKVLTEEIIGLPISLPWLGYGSAIFMELGELKPDENKRLNYERGQAQIHAWNWRFEQGCEVLFGCSNSGPEIEEGLKRLTGKHILNIEIIGEVKELEITFSDNIIFKTMIMCNDNPDWEIKLIKDEYIYSKKGSLYLGDGINELTEEEEIECEIAKITVNRWGIPFEEEAKGKCSDCSNFIRIDGRANFLDYGVCISSNSKFDGRIVNFKSACQNFEIV